MTTRVRRRLAVQGTVQGVGFRPFVHRLATELALDGEVRNDGAVVEVDIAGPEDAIETFERRLRTEAPAAASIDTIRSVEAPPATSAESGGGFSIAASAGRADAGPAPVPADRALCDACRRELFDPTDRRHRHPFISCTACGPRFTIVETLPYDRETTTMADHEMCPACRTEYEDPGDRRHHAQTIACPDCGPRLRLELARPTAPGDPAVPATTDGAIGAAQAALTTGAVLAVKGVGGYHLAVDATDDEAVARLRHRKQRPDKPFAVMVADLAAAHRHAHLDEAEAALLTSPARPIVLVTARAESPVSADVAPGSPLIGLMLPATPVQHLLLAPVPGGASRPPEMLVMTSGNLSGEPICHDDAEAADRLGPLVDGFLTHDRRIHHPCDDSVVRVIAGRPTVLRRSRGLAPAPVALPIRVEPVLAVGGDLKNTFCLAAGRWAWASQHLGDMADLASLESFERAVGLLSQLTAPGISPAVACDRHPGYRTSAWARARGSSLGEPLGVGHHHAHVAALMAEHGLDGTTPIIGFAFDGTGHGDDGTAWGGEVLVADYDGARRVAHLRPTGLPGGDAAVRNPCRTALAHLEAAGVAWADDLAPVAATSDDERRIVAGQLGAGAATTSMGRLFDAVASLLDVRHRITYEAQAAIELEFLARAAAPGTGPALAFTIDDDGIDPRPVVRELVAHRRAGTGVDALARAFHDAVVDAVVVVAGRIRRSTGLTTVGITGGVFQNTLIVEGAARALESAGFGVLRHERIPPNDGGLCLGQAVVAGRRRVEAG